MKDMLGCIIEGDLYDDWTAINYLINFIYFPLFLFSKETILLYPELYHLYDSHHFNNQCDHHIVFKFKVD
ncbi:hypothetical protein [Neobacillus sp. 204]|uniref:hypothetical protein n=1 Tax=Neobacillus sp. 204 TaxID=3383351 RepID=UPI00397C6A08